MDFQFNVSLGREVEFYNRVNNSDPTNAVLTWMVLASDAIEEDADLRERTTFADILSGSSDEVTNVGYARDSYDDADLAAYAVDNDAREIRLSIPVVTFPSIAAGDTWAKFILGYDSDSTGGTDSGIIPVTAHDMLYQGSYVVPNGDDILWDLSAGFVVARART